MKKASILLMITTIFSKIIGFIREQFTASILGRTGPIASAFSYSFGLPVTLFSIISAAFVTGFIPMFTRVEAEEGKEKAEEFSNNVLNIMLLISLIISIVFLLFTKPLINFLLPGVDGADLSIYIEFVRIAVFSILGTSSLALLAGYLSIKRSFVVANLMGLPMSIIIIIFLFMSNSIGYSWLPWGIAIAYLSQGVLIILYAMTKGFRYKPTLNVKDPHLITMLKLAVPLIIGTSTAALGTLVNQAIISNTPDALATWSYAMRVGSMAYAIFGISIVNVMYPAVSKSISAGNIVETKKSYGDALISMLVFLVPAVVGFIVLAYPIVQVVYVRNNFTMSDVAPVAKVLMAYSISIVPTGILQLTQRIFYGYQDTKTPMTGSLISIGSQILLSYPMYLLLGVPGSSLAMGLGTTIGTIYLWTRLMKKFESFPIKKYGRQMLKIVIAATIMGIATYASYWFLTRFVSSNMATLLSIVVAMVVYLGVVLYLRVEAVDNLIQSFRSRRG